ncbi:lactate 2-monooxygenase [Deinococcus yavapaiensis]|uniref:Lactate 2-monooxygenase n=1 Tax=Deinococcus yavapaiensis KR-236 TaxID=694435 RepID=A0A318SSG1_9DEIO|nr:lactate 2-monooxygenase [Deinococcus yavapaiensis]PYE55947.1 lactate 2-monooxygenase [Deinococcus yavapaiensis KR-236]
MSLGRSRQTRLYVRGLGGEKPRVPTDFARLERAAHEKMTPRGYAYVAGGAGLETTMRANRAAFERYTIVPRVLRGLDRRDSSVTLFGRTLPSPLLLAPIGVLEAAHSEADLAVAKASAATGVPFVFSSQASSPMEACAKVMKDAPRWFQLYWSTDDDVTRSFVKRAEACGCEAIVLTLDTTLLGWRPRDLNLGSLPFLRGQGIAQYLSDPVFRARLDREDASPSESPPRSPALALVARDLVVKGRQFDLDLKKMRAAVARFVGTYSRPDLSWDDVSRLREMTRLPILLKGVLHGDDAREAVGRGVNGLIVSNHGGRQIDGEVAALDALPDVVEAAGAAPVLFDSGVRSGADVFKALALGARAVLLGRPYVYGLALAGADGVRDVIENVLAELDLTMGLAGCGSLADVNRAMVRSSSS